MTPKNVLLKLEKHVNINLVCLTYETKQIINFCSQIMLVAKMYVKKRGSKALVLRVGILLCPAAQQDDLVRVVEYASSG